MKAKKRNTVKIWLTVPEQFLQQFDQLIQGNFASRSEAIRRGMQLVLEEIKKRCEKYERPV